MHSSHSLQAFDYVLPDALIAQAPLDVRSESRLMVLDSESGGISHSRFSSLGDFLRSGDVLVFNESRVINARLNATRVSGGQVECFLLKDLGDGVWEALLKRSRRLDVGEILRVAEGFELEILRLNPESGVHEVCLISDEAVYAAIEAHGKVPLPPYIAENEDAEVLARYQSIFAKDDGSVAAPTASLHFSNDLVADLASRGIEKAVVSLHVGYGTFQPISSADIRDHEMHFEAYSVSDETAAFLNQVKAEGRRVIAVGTTVCRTLEACFREGRFVAGSEETNLFISPGYEFEAIDGLITNFHLPKSSLLVLVAALAGLEFVMRAYDEAISEEYRFFSFGDGMLVL